MAYQIRVLRFPPPLNGTIRATITHDPAVVTQWITNVSAYLSLPRVRPKFVYLALLPEQSFEIPHVLQILVHRECLFIQLAHARRQMPDSLRWFLANSHYTFVGSYIDFALSRLHFYYQIGSNSTQSLELWYRFRPPLKTDWTVRELAPYQIIFCLVEGVTSYLIAVARYKVSATYRAVCDVTATLN